MIGFWKYTDTVWFGPHLYREDTVWYIWFFWKKFDILRIKGKACLIPWDWEANANTKELNETFKE